MKRLGAVLLGLLLALLGCELVMRVFEIRPARYTEPRWEVLRDGAFRPGSKVETGAIKNRSRFARQGVRMGEYVSGATFRVCYDTNPRGYFEAENSVTMRINALGLRGPEVEHDKPEGTFRILGLGDSFTFGDGVKEQDTFLRRLEGSLNSAEGVHVEVLNAGTQGYNTRDEVLYLEHRWLELEPDLVLIGFYLNDAYSDETFMNRGQALGIYAEAEGFARHSYLFDYIWHVRTRRLAGEAVQEYYRQQYFQRAGQLLPATDAKTGEIDWNVSRSALARAGELAREHGFALALVIIPELYELDGDYPFEAIHQLVVSACEELQIPVLDMLAVLRGMDERDLWVHPSDHHWNEVGHEHAARAIEAFLHERGLLPESTRH